MMILGYWNLRGFAQPIRILLEYLGVEYQEKHYSSDGEEWINKDKNELKSNFPNLPYLIDGDFVLTESIAIPIYLIKKFQRNELLGQNPNGSFNQNEAIIFQVYGVIKDLRQLIFSSSMDPSFKQNKETLYNENYLLVLEKLKKQLRDQEFLVGNFTYADILFYDFLNIFTEYISRVENIPQIRKYLDTKENKIYVLDRMKDKFYI